MKNTFFQSQHNKKISPAKKAAYLGMLSALAIAFSYLENLVPQLPFLPPGAKAGFSNIVTMYTAVTFSLPFALTVSIIKSGFVLLTRGFTAFILSLCGGIASATVMWLIFRFSNGFGFIGMGISGAVTHNIFQLAAAMLITETFSLYYYLPALLIFAVAAGTLTGFIMKVTIPVLNKITGIFYIRKG